MSFHIGQEVECVVDHCDLSVWPPYGNATKFGIFKGKTYTVVGFSKWNNLILAGIESAWVPARFRPVTKTDISIFTALLTDTKHKEPSDA